MSDNKKVDFGNLMQQHIANHTTITIEKTDIKTMPNFIFKHFGKIFITIFVLGLLGSLTFWGTAFYLAARLGPKAVTAAENALES